VIERETRYLLYILDAIRLIEERTASGKAEFLASLDEQDAVLWRLYTLADAALQLSDDLKLRHPNIPWTRIRGFRNIAAHGNLDLLIELGWEIIDVHLPQLKAVVEQDPESS
jgi:uncharacterized protein with HEPN domain